MGFSVWIEAVRNTRKNRVESRSCFSVLLLSEMGNSIQASIFDREGNLLQTNVRHIKEASALYPDMYSLAPAEKNGRILGIRAIRGDTAFSHRYYVLIEGLRIFVSLHNLTFVQDMQQTARNASTLAMVRRT